MTLASVPRSLRLRLLLGTLFWIAASIIVAGWGLSGLFRQHVETQFHAELTMHLDQLAAHLNVDEQGRPSLAQPLSDPRLSRPYSGCYWQVDALDATADGRPPAIGLLRSRSLWDAVLTVPLDMLADGEVHRHRITGPEGKTLGMVERSIRIGDRPDGSPRNFRLIAAADEAQMEAPVASLNGMLWLALGLLGAGLILAAVIQVFVGLSPLRRLRTALGKVREGETPTLEGSFPSEITPLVDEFNSVLAQNAAVVERARTQAGNLAHSLKTPLSVLANAAYAHDADLPQLVSDQVALARRQVDYHLARAQAAAAASRQSATKAPVMPVLEGLVRVMQHIHIERQLTIRLPQQARNPVFRGEAQDLQEMLGNLLDNACKWAAQHVDVAVECKEGLLQITIDDDGPGLAEERHDEVLQRGVRADEQVPGSGLGLSIVADVAQLYGGTVTLSKSPMGGVRAALTLPGAVD